MLIKIELNFIIEFLLKNNYKCNTIERHIKIFSNNRIYGKELLKHDLELLIKESILIKHLKPNLNTVDFFTLAVYYCFLY